VPCFCEGTLSIGSLELTENEGVRLTASRQVPAICGVKLLGEGETRWTSAPKKDSEKVSYALRARSEWRQGLWPHVASPWTALGWGH
jgi:hypothetical protein